MKEGHENKVYSKEVR